MVSTRGKKEADRQERDRVRLLLLHSQLVHRRAAILCDRIGLAGIPSTVSEISTEDVSCAICYSQLGEESTFDSQIGSMVDCVKSAVSGSGSVDIGKVRNSFDEGLLLQLSGGDGEEGEWLLALMAMVYPCGLLSSSSPRGGADVGSLDPFPTGLDSCSHLFCFTCINQWATQSTKCPMCRQRFKAVSLFPYWFSQGGGASSSPSSPAGLQTSPSLLSSQSGGLSGGFGGDSRVSTVLAIWQELTGLLLDVPTATISSALIEAATITSASSTTLPTTTTTEVNPSLLALTSTFIVAVQTAVAMALSTNANVGAGWGSQSTASFSKKLSKKGIISKGGVVDAASALITSLREMGLNDSVRGTSAGVVERDISHTATTSTIGKRARAKQSTTTATNSRSSSSSTSTACEALAQHFGISVEVDVTENKTATSSSATPPPPPSTNYRVDLNSDVNDWLPLLPISVVTGGSGSNVPQQGDFITFASKELLPYMAAAVSHLVSALSPPEDCSHRQLISFQQILVPSHASAPLHILLVSLVVRGLLGMISLQGSGDGGGGVRASSNTVGVLPVVEVKYASHDYFHTEEEEPEEEEEDDEQAIQNAIQEMEDRELGDRADRSGRRQQGRRGVTTATRAEVDDEDRPISSLVTQEGGASARTRRRRDRSPVRTHHVLSYVCQLCNRVEYHIPSLLMCTRPDCNFTSHRTCLVNELLPTSGPQDFPLTLANVMQPSTQEGSGGGSSSQHTRRRELFALLSSRDYECTSCLLKAGAPLRRDGDLITVEEEDRRLATTTRAHMPIPAFLRGGGRAASSSPRLDASDGAVSSPPQPSPLPVMPTPVRAASSAASSQPNRQTISRSGSSSGGVASSSSAQPLLRQPSQSQGGKASQQPSQQQQGVVRSSTLSLLERLNSGKGLLQRGPSSASSSTPPNVVVAASTPISAPTSLTSASYFSGTNTPRLGQGGDEYLLQTAASVKERNTNSFIREVQGDHSQGLAFLDERKRAQLYKSGSGGGSTRSTDFNSRFTQGLPDSQTALGGRSSSSSLIGSQSTLLRGAHQTPQQIQAAADREQELLAQERRARVVKTTLAVLESKRRSYSGVGPTFDAFGNIKGVRDAVTTHNGELPPAMWSYPAASRPREGTTHQASVPNISGSNELVRFMPSQRSLRNRVEDRNENEDTTANNSGDGTTKQEPSSSSASSLLADTSTAVWWRSSAARSGALDGGSGTSINEARAQAAGDASVYHWQNEATEARRLHQSKMDFMRRAREQVALERLRALVQGTRRVAAGQNHLSNPTNGSISSIVIPQQTTTLLRSPNQNTSTMTATVPPRPTASNRGGVDEDVGELLADLWSE